MKTAAVIKDGEVINLIVVDKEMPTFKGCDVVLSDEASIGDRYDGTSFKKPPAITPAPMPRMREPTPAEKLAASGLTVEELQILLKAH